MPPLQTFLFDLDGTLIDSVRLILDSYHHTLAAHGLPPRSDDEWLRGVGTPLTTQFAEWRDSGLLDALVATYREYNLAHHDRMLIAEVIVRATEQLLVAVGALEKNRDGTVLNACVQVKRLEEEGDSLYHQWLARLFEGQPDALTVIKWKEIYDNLEKTLDYIEDAGNVLESISIKHG